MYVQSHKKPTNKFLQTPTKAEDYQRSHDLCLPYSPMEIYSKSYPMGKVVNVQTRQWLMWRFGRQFIVEVVRRWVVSHAADPVN